ncbi:hypothetical protein KCP69_01875 [Salmonella enterica subsp. enterica]|nr:hypothetical protein KCP69_01875 [Salmonella enterica subsp. enterica]
MTALAIFRSLMGFESKMPYTDDGGAGAISPTRRRGRVWGEEHGFGCSRRAEERRITCLRLCAEAEARPTCRFLINYDDVWRINPDDMRARNSGRLSRPTSVPVACGHWRRTGVCAVRGLAIIAAKNCNCILSAAVGANGCAPIHQRYSRDGRAGTTCAQ